MPATVDEQTEFMRAWRASRDSMRLHTLQLSGYGNIVGSVRNPDGSPVRSFTIKIALADYDNMFEYAFEDDDGRFQLLQVMPGHCRVHVVADGFLEGLIPVEVLPDDTTRGVDFRLRRPAALRIEVRETKGPIRIEDGARRTVGLSISAGAAVAVALRPADPASSEIAPQVSLFALDAENRPTPKELTSEGIDEFFVAHFTGVPPGRYLVTCGLSAPSDSAEVTLDVGTSTKVRLTFRMGTRVRFDTINQEDGTSIFSAQVRIHQPDGRSFECNRTASLPNGEFEATAFGEGLQDHTVRFQVGTDLPTRITIPMKEA